MLSRSPASRRRLASGAGAVALLIVAGLGLTASGSGAAAVAGAVGTGIAVQQPSAPPAPLRSATAPVGKVRHIVVVRDGKTVTYEGAAADAFIAENRSAYDQALEGLLTARRSIATQVTSAFPEIERRRALAAVDTSIAKIEADLAQTR